MTPWLGGRCESSSGESPLVKGGAGPTGVTCAGGQARGPMEGAGPG